MGHFAVADVGVLETWRLVGKGEKDEAWHHVKGLVEVFSRKRSVCTKSP